jgi:hypothetical protein
MTTNAPTQLRTLRAELDARHTALWRQVSMSSAWQELQQIEARLGLLAELIDDEEPQAGEPTQPPQAEEPQGEPPPLQRVGTRARGRAAS